ncbi:MAG: LamG domain-containing protein [Deltaproteobacteria bacterium]|jgi:hypothetical protein|nr:LamG domain-containing protein [Deltaproteobacteria bacterium]MBW2531625.1 LamG domain-containing protein [Deltaproteobacteria bacterium]
MSQRGTLELPVAMVTAATAAASFALLTFEGCALVAGVEEGTLDSGQSSATGGATGSGVPGGSGGTGATSTATGGSGTGVAGVGGGGGSGTTYAEEVLSDDPLAYWRLGEDTTPVANDASGNGHDGTFVGGITVSQPGAIAGDPDTAVHFDGGAEVTVGDVFGFDGTAPFSAEAWIKPETDAASFIGKAARPSGSFIGWLVYFQDGLLTMRRGDILDCQGAAPVSNQFTHVVATYDGLTMRVYANGVEVGTRQSSSSVPVHSEPFTFGRTYQWGAFQGVMDEVAVYGANLSPARILAHYEKGMGTR